MTPLAPEDIVPPDLPENTAGIINLLIDAMKLGEFRNAANSLRVGAGSVPFTRAMLHEIDQLCHRLGVAAGVPSWYWLEFIMPRAGGAPCTEPGCTQPQTDGGPHCDDRTF